MKPLPVTYASAVLRVDFEDDDAWQRVRDAALAPFSPADSHLAVLDDRDYEGLDLTGLAEAPKNYEERVLIVFDAQSREQPDNPLLLIDWLADEDEDDEEHFIPRAVRVLPGQVQTVETNLTLGNMDFEDFAEKTDADGIFRGFR